MVVETETPTLAAIPAELTRALRAPVWSSVVRLLHVRKQELIWAKVWHDRNKEFARASELKAQRIDAVLRALGVDRSVRGARLSLDEVELEEKSELSVKRALGSWSERLADDDTEQKALIDSVARVLCFDAKHLVHLLETVGPAPALEYLATFVDARAITPIESADVPVGERLGKAKLLRVYYLLHRERMRRSSAQERKMLVSEQDGLHKLLCRAFACGSASFKVALKKLQALEDGQDVEPGGSIVKELQDSALKCPVLSACTLDGEHRAAEARMDPTGAADPSAAERANKRARLAARGAFAHSPGLSLCEVRPPPPPELTGVPRHGVRNLVFLSALAEPPEYTTKRGSTASAGVCAQHEDGQIVLYSVRDPAREENWSAWCAGGPHGAVVARCPASADASLPAQPALFGCHRTVPPSRAPTDGPHAMYTRSTRNLFVLSDGSTCAHFSLISSKTRPSLCFLRDIFCQVGGNACLQEVDQHMYGRKIERPAEGALCVALGGRSQWIFVTARCVRVVQIYSSTDYDPMQHENSKYSFAAKESPHSLGDTVQRCAIEAVDPAEESGDSVYMALVSPTSVQIMRVDRFADGKFTVVPTTCVERLASHADSASAEPLRVLSAEWHRDEADRVLVVVTTAAAMAFTLAPEYNEDHPPSLSELWSLPAHAFAAADDLPHTPTPKLRAAALAPCGGLAADGRWCECVLLVCTERHLLVLGPITGADGVPAGGSAFSLAQGLSAALKCAGAPPKPTSMAVHTSQPLAFIGLDNGGVIMARYTGAAGDPDSKEAAVQAFPSPGFERRLKNVGAAP